MEIGLSYAHPHCRNYYVTQFVQNLPTIGTLFCVSYFESENLTALVYFVNDRTVPFLS
jgi:hypothetical protein